MDKSNWLNLFEIMTDASADGDTTEWTILQSVGNYATNGGTVTLYTQFLTNSIPIIDNGYSYPPIGLYSDSVNQTYKLEYPETTTKELWSLAKLDKDGNFINCGE